MLECLLPDSFGLMFQQRLYPLIHKSFAFIGFYPSVYYGKFLYHHAHHQMGIAFETLFVRQHCDLHRNRTRTRYRRVLRFET